MSHVALTVYGVLALTFMMAMYALERRDRRYVLAFACGCALASSYGFLSGAWPFGVVEAVWALVALRRFSRDDRRVGLSQGRRFPGEPWAGIHTGINGQVNDDGPGKRGGSGRCDRGMIRLRDAGTGPRSRRLTRRRSSGRESLTTPGGWLTGS
jgi:hypothetical protein